MKGETKRCFDTRREKGLITMIVGVEQIHDLLVLLLQLTFPFHSDSHSNHVSSLRRLDRLDSPQQSIQVQQEQLKLAIDKLLEVFAVRNRDHQHIAQIDRVRIQHRPIPANQQHQRQMRRSFPSTRSLLSLLPTVNPSGGDVVSRYSRSMYATEY